MKWALVWFGFITMAFAKIGAIFPFWKSATLSPDSIQRRTYWMGNTLAAFLLAASQIPDWRSISFFIPAMLVWFALIAFKWCNHIRINGRVYAMDPVDRRTPDRPPALARDCDCDSGF